MTAHARPLLVLTQGEAAGIGPEICLWEVERWLAVPRNTSAYQPLLLMERAALDSMSKVLPQAWSRVTFIEPELETPGALRQQCEYLLESGLVPAIEPMGCDASRLPVVFGQPGPADARGAMAAIRQGVALCLEGEADAVVTAPVNKAVIAEHVDPNFKGHTDTIAEACSRRLGSKTYSYGRDYLMAFVSNELNVALLSTHVPLRQALRNVTTERVVEALVCLDRAIKNSNLGGRRIALAGLNPHAGEGGLLGAEDDAVLVPAVRQARLLDVDVAGPESADTLFLRAKGGEFDWVLALYHDQGLIPVKTLGFGEAVNWTAGLPVIRTSVDHGTAYALAGKGQADPAGMFGAVDFAVRLVGATLETATDGTASARSQGVIAGS